MPEKKTAIVTGASHGIGAGLVGAFLKEGYFVVSRPGIHATTPESTIGYRRFHRGFWIGEPTGERGEQASTTGRTGPGNTLSQVGRLLAPRVVPNPSIQ